jgi:sugar phosphate isomerase/epimerase
MTVTSLAGSFGETEGELEAACGLARALGVDLLVGRLRFLDADRETAVAVLARHGVTYAIENHDERGPAENAERIDVEPGRPWVAAAIDTGWYGTHSHDPAAAVELLGDRVAHVHLKNIERPGAHVTTALGEGCLGLRATVRALRANGYTGPIAIEHEPFDRDPSADCAASLGLLRTWLAEE